MRRSKVPKCHFSADTAKLQPNFKQGVSKKQNPFLSANQRWLQIGQLYHKNDTVSLIISFGLHVVD
jgi:hypothetical protein